MCPPHCLRTMGCCFGKKDEEVEPAFDPTIGLSEKARGAGLSVTDGVVSGTGSILADSAVLQDKAYFEVELRALGAWSIGFATKDAPLDGVLSQDKASSVWMLTPATSGLPPLSAGDTLGVALDQGDYPVQLNYYLKVLAADLALRHSLPPAHPNPPVARLRARALTREPRRPLAGQGGAHPVRRARRGVPGILGGRGRRARAQLWREELRIRSARRLPGHH